MRTEEASILANDFANAVQDTNKEHAANLKQALAFGVALSLAVSAGKIADALERLADKFAPKPAETERDYIGMPS